MIVPVLQSRELDAPSGSHVMEVDYVCQSRCKRRWTIVWPIVQGLTNETSPTCADCGSLVTEISRNRIDRRNP